MIDNLQKYFHTEVTDVQHKRKRGMKKPNYITSQLESTD